MARVYTAGAEIGHVTFEGGNSPELTGTPTVSTANPHKIETKGGLSHWRCAPNASPVYVRYPGAYLTGLKEEWTYFRWYISIDKAPLGTREILRITGPESAVHCSFKVTTGGNLVLFNSAEAEIKSFASALSFGTYCLVECAIWAAAAGNGKVKVRINSGEVYENAAITLKNIIPEGTRFGWITAETGATIDIDDIAINNASGASENEWCGAAVVAHLVPTSDKARVGWLVGAAATTNLFAAVDNVPPKGVAQASKTATSQIYDVVSNTTDNYEANLATYTEAGVANAPKLIQPVWAPGSSSGTISTGVSIVSNPVVAEEVANSSGTMGTFPTGWILRRGPVAYAPSVTLGTAPVLKIRKNTATVNAAGATYTGLLVEWKPEEAPPPSGEGRLALLL